MQLITPHHLTSTYHLKCSSKAAIPLPIDEREVASTQSSGHSMCSSCISDLMIDDDDPLYEFNYN